MNKKKQDIATYCESHTTPPSPILQELERQTHLTTLAPQMVSGHLQGRILSMISHLLAPSCVLEIGTFTGYSAICLAEGLAPDGRLHTIDINPEYESLSNHFIETAGMADKIIFYLGDAVEIIPTLNVEFDLVFIDAAKILYQQYYNLVIDKVVSGGVIITDNLLWGGKVVSQTNDPDTDALRAFADFLQKDSRIENILLPIRDGLMICRKI